MEKNKKNTIQILLASVIIFSLFVIGIILPDKDFSDRERRKLTDFPEITEESLFSGAFMKSFESYSYDQFPFRDAFLRLKSFIVRNILMQADDNGYYKIGNHLLKLEYPENEMLIEQNLKKLSDVYGMYIADTDCNTYFSLICDKNYYIGREKGYPVIDYDTLAIKAQNGFQQAKYINITNYLSKESFYDTDLHWKQPEITNVAARLISSMGGDLQAEFTFNNTGNLFYGAYHAQSGIEADPDIIEYMTSEALEKVEVYSFDTGTPVKSYVYNFEKLKGKDPYEFFLSGNQAIQVIESPLSSSQKELILFRDSFGSSLAPLFADYYKRITLIDLRYINSSILGEFVKFTDQDVLFIYSTATFNNTI